MVLSLRGTPLEVPLEHVLLYCAVCCYCYSNSSSSSMNDAVISAV